MGVLIPEGKAVVGLRGDGVQRGLHGAGQQPESEQDGNFRVGVVHDGVLLF
ncbi:hypothetical protein D3C84_1286860 [compost metagenome]